MTLHFWYLAEINRRIGQSLPFLRAKCSTVYSFNLFCLMGEVLYIADLYRRNSRTLLVYTVSLEPQLFLFDGISPLRC